MISVITAAEERVLVALGPDEAMKSFFTFSRFSLLVADLSPDGREMQYKLIERTRGEESLRQARLVIELFELPLAVTLDEFKIGDFVVEAKLILKYVGQ